MKRTFAILALVLATATGLKAQQGGGYNESVVVRGSYNPEIEPSEKLTFPAVITDTLSRIEHAFSYNITPHRLKALYEPARIKAARIVGEPATKLYNNYLRLGMGNYWSPLADLYWSSTRDREKTYGVRINHRSSWGSLPDHGPNHMNQTGVTLFGKYIVADKLQLSTDLGYEPALRDSLSLEKHVKTDTPPVFLVNCIDDPIVDYHNSVVLDSALVASGVSHRYLQFATGGHGFGADLSRQNSETKVWQDEFLNWFHNERH